MANYYVDSSATGAANGTSWTDAWTSIGSASGLAGGDVVFVDHSHSETGSAIAVNFGGTLVSPVLIYSVDKDNSNALSTMLTGGGKISTGTAGSALDISFSGGYYYMYGLNLESEDNITPGFRATHDTCNMVFRDQMSVALGDYMEFRNCTFDNLDSGGPQFNSFGRGSVSKFIGCTFNATNGNSNPLFTSTLQGDFVLFQDCDLSNFSPVVFAIGDANTYGWEGTQTILSRCKLKTGGVVSTDKDDMGSLLVDSCTTGTISAPVLGVQEWTTKFGTQTSETGVYRTDGATDGETPHSWKLVSTARTTEGVWGFETTKIVRWVEAGSQTLTVYLAGGATMNDDDFWVEVSSPNETASPNQTAQGNFQSTRMAPLATPAALTTDSASTWSGTGVGTKQKIDITINPTEPGPVTVRCFLAKPSTTVYVDPVIAINGNTSGDSYAVEGVQLNKTSVGGPTSRHPLARF